ncbi:MAG: MBL fold metallo-hydrolase [Anaerolineales bacterium]|nr:MBL fold metallo-hydrolase [Anaerolineales bacterium]
MEIVWHGLSCFRFMERGLASVVTDPYSPGSGLSTLRLKADIVTVSHDEPNHSYTKAVKGMRRTITGPGEYEIGGVFITGLPMHMKSDNTNGTKPNTLYVFDFNGVTIAHLGDLSYVPSQAQIENLGAVNIALVPVGGGGSLSPSQASEVISLIEPSIVIPMQFKTGSEKLKLGAVSGFLKEMGITKLDPLPSLKISKSGLSEETQVIQLKPRG